MAFRILSCDGGGIRGLITAVWLQRLEHKLGGPLRDYFDMAAGTSTGSMLACGISLGIPASQIVELYLKRGAEVFPPFQSRMWERLQRTFTDGLSAPRYDGLGLEYVLKDVFGKRTMGDLQLKPTLAIAYNTMGRQAVVFKNTLPDYAELPIWEVVRASCAAPVYFPAHVMSIERARVPLIDGAVVANNPTSCAIAEAVRFNKEQPHAGLTDPYEYIVASFGTGQATRQIGIEEARSWGGLQWVLPVIDVIFDGVSAAVDYVARQLIADERYFRFQVRLEDALDDLDNASPNNLNALVAVAEDALANGGDHQLDKLAALLKAERARRLTALSDEMAKLLATPAPVATMLPGPVVVVLPQVTEERVPEHPAPAAVKANKPIFRVDTPATQPDAGPHDLIRQAFRRAKPTVKQPASQRLEMWPPKATSD